MTRLKLVFGVLLAGGVLGGCGSKALVLEPMPEITPLVERVAPETEDLTFVATLAHEPVAEDDLDVTYRDDFRVHTDATVVISVPVEEQEREKRSKGGAGAGGGGNDLLDSDGITSFKTTGYFNKAEQQIEKELMRKKFIVLDRSKFEAKLRDLRAKTESYRIPAAEAELRAMWKKQLEGGKITEAEFSDKMRESERRTDISTQEDSRKGEKELVDISELIRAAQSGETRSDYILQVNRFYVNTSSDEVVDLLDLEEVQGVASENPGFSRALTEAGQATVQKPGFYGVLNAKLINVQSGAIVWVGALRVDVQNALKEGLKITVPVTKKVRNGNEINGAIRSYNEDLNRLAEECERRQQAAETAQAEKGVMGGGDVVAARVMEYEQCVGKVKGAAQRGPSPTAQKEWEHQYDFEPLRVKPLLPSEADLERLRERWSNSHEKKEKDRIKREWRKYQDLMGQYYSSLAKLVAKELISTIPAE